MKIILNERTEEHVKVFWNKTRDAEIQEMFPFSARSLEQALIQFSESRQADAASYGRVIYSDGAYIGDVWCYNIDQETERHAMLSIVIFEKCFWGRGIAAAALSMFVQQIFERFSIDRIGAFAFSDNQRSIGLLRKIGFVEIEAFVEAGRESKYLELERGMVL